MNTHEILRQLDHLYQTGNGKTIADYLRTQMNAAETEGDLSTLLTLQNEYIGLCRVTGANDEGAAIYRKVEREIERMDLLGSQADAGSMLNYASLCRAAGWLDEAERLFSAVHVIYEKTPGLEPYRMASFLNNYSLLLMERKDADRALTIMEKAKSIIDVLSDSTVERATTRVNMAQAHMELGHVEEAGTLLTEADSLFAELDHEDPHVASLYHAKGCLYDMQGNREEAVRWWTKAQQLRERTYGRRVR